MNSRIQRVFSYVAAVAVAGWACSDSGGRSDLASSGAEARARADAEHREPEGHESGHGHDEISDLDRPVKELFSDECEHGIPAYSCEECRYEVGVVEAPARLFEGGLLERTRVQQRTMAAPLRLTGEIRFDQRRVAHVSTQTEGVIRKVYVTLGDAVERGQALLEIESVEVGAAQADYLEAQGLMQLAKRNHDRLAALRDEGISSEKEVLRAKQEMDSARIRVEAALGRLTRLGMAAGAVRALTSKRATGKLALRAPASGTVLQMHAVAGEIAQSEESLVTVGDNRSLWLWADLYERDLSRVAAAQADGPLDASVFVKAFPETAFPGKVDFISPAMDSASRTVKLRIAVPNPEGRLLAGMFANVDLFLPGKRKAFAVPKSAVLSDEGRSFVFVHHDGDFYVRRPVVCGPSDAEWTEIAEGLSGDETVVADGAFLMKSDVLRSKMGAGCAD